MEVAVAGAQEALLVEEVGDVGGADGGRGRDGQQEVAVTGLGNFRGVQFISHFLHATKPTGLIETNSCLFFLSIKVQKKSKTAHTSMAAYVIFSGNRFQI